ncbi:DUF1573 domain-containing protein [Bacteroidota bacterium]
MKSLLNILLLLIPFAVAAQKVKWENTTVNFGVVQDWNSPPAVFKYKNTGNKKLFFLPQKHGRDALVKYPINAINPGETGDLIIHYYTAEKGSFSKTIDIYTSASNAPEKLTLKGNIKSIYADALTACPSFHDKQPVENTVPNVVQTVDATTNQPIPNAQVEVFNRGIRKAVNATNLEGVAVNWVEKGKHVVVASKSGYLKAEQELRFNKSDRTQVVYMYKQEADVKEPFVADKPAENSITEIPDLGINTDAQWDDELPQEEPVITKNEVPVPDQTEEFDLGVALNDQWDEPKDLVVDSAETVLEGEVDFGVQSNSQWDDEIMDVETATAESEPVSVEKTVKEELVSTESIEVAVLETPLDEPEFALGKYRPNNVLLLMDVSGSMKDDRKMDKLKASVRRLIMMLREVDVLTLIAYNSTSWEVLPPTPVADNEGIVALVDSLQPSGYTNGVKGMESAYESLKKQLISGGNNQLIIATDGKFNSSKFSEKEALQMVKMNSEEGIVLSIIGFGEDPDATKLMKKLAKEGNGSFMQISKDEDPTELLAEEIKMRSR